MAKLRPIEFKQRNATNDQLEFRSEVSVSQDGTFSLTIPEGLTDSAAALVKLPCWRQQVTVNKAKVNWRIESKDLALAQNFIETTMKDYLAVDVTRELVILYRQHNDIAYYQDDLGGLHPNGQGVASGEWKGNLNTTERAPFFSIGLAAWVASKVTHTRGSSVKIVYERASPEDRDNHPLLARLDRFVGLTREVGRHQDSQQMPYSDEAAAFFIDAMFAMCRMAQKMDQFFGEPARLVKAIGQHQSQLEGPVARLLDVDLG